MNPDHPQRRPFFTATYLFATPQRASGLASDAPVTHEAESAAPQPRSNYLLVPEWTGRERGCAISLCTANHPCTLSLHERDKRRARKGRGSLVFMTAEGSIGGLEETRTRGQRFVSEYCELHGPVIG